MAAPPDAGLSSPPTATPPRRRRDPRASKPPRFQEPSTKNDPILPERRVQGEGQERTHARPPHFMGRWRGAPSRLDGGGDSVPPVSVHPSQLATSDHCNPTPFLKLRLIFRHPFKTDPYFSLPRRTGGLSAGDLRAAGAMQRGRVSFRRPRRLDRGAWLWPPCGSESGFGARKPEPSGDQPSPADPPAGGLFDDGVKHRLPSTLLDKASCGASSLRRTRYSLPPTDRANARRSATLPAPSGDPRHEADDACPFSSPFWVRWLRASRGDGGGTASQGGGKTSRQAARLVSAASQN